MISINFLRLLFTLALWLCGCVGYETCEGGTCNVDYGVFRCIELEKSYSRGFLTLNERDEYCFNKCKFLKVACYDTAVSKPLEWKRVYAEFERFMNAVLSDDEPEMFEDEMITNEIIDVWIALAHRMSTMLVGFIPVLMNQWKAYNYWSATLCCTIVIALSISGFSTPAIAIHNMVMVVVSMLHNPNSHALPESVITVVVLIIPIFASFVASYAWQLLICIALLFGFFIYIYHVFFVRRRGNDISSLVMISQVYVLYEQMEFIRTYLAADSAIGAAVDICLSSIIPKGKSKWMFKNVGIGSSTIYNHFAMGSLNPIIFVIIYVTHWIMFLSFRASLGTFYLYVLRYKLNYNAIKFGAWVYTTDVFDPFFCMWRLVCSRERPTVRRFMYCAFSAFLLYSEVTRALEIFFLRFILSFFDRLVFHTEYGRAVRYLEFNVDFMQEVFPQEGALPWLNLALLGRISENTGKLLSKRGKKTYAGMGVLLRSGGKLMLYTVKHVIKDSELVTFMGNTYSSPCFNKLKGSDGDDPIVAMKIDEGDAPDVELIMPGDIPFIKNLVFINTDKNDNPSICIVPKFSIVKNDILASVTLKRGDSGGPCFAVLDTGALRLCGVVSAGNPRSGGGNIVSFVYHTGKLDHDSSDEDESIKVTRFNGLRRPRRMWDNQDDYMHQRAVGLTHYLNDNRDIFEGFKHWKEKITSDIIDEDINGPSWSHIFADLEAPRVSFGESNIDDDDPGEGGERKRKKRKDNKRSQKDKAARKQMAQEGRVLWEKLKQIYTVVDSKNIFDAIMSGDVPELGNRDIIYNHNYGDWMITDSLDE